MDTSEKSFKDIIEEGNDDLWVFVSHSTKDFEKVRIIRNKMEEIGMRPLLCYLKCLKDKPEVIELLKREIEVRPRFLLCDSPNARGSEFVNEEIKYIKSLKRQYVTVDLNDESSYDEKIRELKRRSQIFLSYSRQDYDFVRKLTKALQKIGFSVWLDMENLISGKYEEQIDKAIEKSIYNGYFIPVISESYLRSSFCRAEFQKAILYNKNCQNQRVIPICTDEESLKLCSDLFPLFCDGTTQGIDNLVKDIQQIDLKKNI